MSKFLNAYLPPIAWAALIFFLSAQSTLPSLEANIYDYLFKKVAHITVYAVLYLLVYRAMALRQFTAKQLKFWPVIICFLYAVTDETHQAFTPGRHPHLMDLGYDLVGVGIMWLRKNPVLARFL